jgi:hypothetical protein
MEQEVQHRPRHKQRGCPLPDHALATEPQVKVPRPSFRTPQARQTTTAWRSYAESRVCGYATKSDTPSSTAQESLDAYASGEQNPFGEEPHGSRGILGATK